MKLLPRLAARMVVLAVLFAGTTAFSQNAAPTHHDVVIKNAVVMTVTHGNLKNGSVYIKDGKIAAVGESVTAPAGATR